jgi:hypothetical protein
MGHLAFHAETDERWLDTPGAKVNQAIRAWDPFNDAGPGCPGGYDGVRVHHQGG